MNGYVEVKDILATIWRGKWFIVSATIIAAAGAFAISSYSTPIYESSTTLLINQVTDPRTLDLSPSLTSARLARTFGEMLTARPIMEESVARIGLDENGFEGSVSVSLISDTQLIELTVQDANPIRAAVLANAMVEVFTEQNDAQQAGRFAASKASLSVQLDRLNETIRSLENRIQELSAIPVTLDQSGEARFTDPETSESELDSGDGDSIAVLETPQSQASEEFETDTDELEIAKSESRLAELGRLHAELSQYRISYTDLLLSYEELRIAEAQSASTIFIVEPAIPSSEPVLPRTAFNTLVAGVIGGTLALVMIFLLKQVDDSVKTPLDVARATGLDVIGYVASSRKLSARGSRQDFLFSQPNSGLAESFRALRTSIELSGPQGTPRSLLVSSLAKGEGKTTIAAQLAMSIAQGGKNVVLIDANFRQPTIHQYLGLGNKLGLSDMLVDDLVPQVVYQESTHWRLKVITSGSQVDNYADLLGSVQMLKVLTRLRSQADVAIFDGPPLLASESFVLASKLESVLLVFRYGRTRAARANPMVAKLNRAQANVMGVVMNRVPPRGARVFPGNLSYGHGARVQKSKPLTEDFDNDDAMITQPNA